MSDGLNHRIKLCLLVHNTISGQSPTSLSVLTRQASKIQRLIRWSAQWRGGRVVYGSGLENQRVSNGTVGSNPTLSVSEHKKVRSMTGPFCCLSSLLATIIAVIWSSEKASGYRPSWRCRSCSNKIFAEILKAINQVVQDSLVLMVSVLLSMAQNPEKLFYLEGLFLVVSWLVRHSN